MSIRFAVPFLFAFTAFLSACQMPASRPVLAEGARWEKVSSAGKGTGEGVVAAKDGMVYLVDLEPPGVIFRFNPRTGETTKLMEPSGMTNGLHFDRNGEMLLAQSAPGVQAVSRRNMASGAVTVLADRYQGKRLIAPNDITTDDAGRIYFTDGRYNQVAEPELPNAIYRLDPDGRLTQLNTDMGRPNGIEVSPDGKRLYVADTVGGTLRPNPHGPAASKFGITSGGVAVYDLAPDGSISNGRLFWRTEVGRTDGMAMDTEGNLYVAATNNVTSQVVALSPDGRVIQEFPLPQGVGTVQLGFGRGDDSQTLYLSTRPWGLYRIRTSKTGFYRG